MQQLLSTYRSTLNPRTEAASDTAATAAADYDDNASERRWSTGEVRTAGDEAECGRPAVVVGTLVVLLALLLASVLVLTRLSIEWGSARRSAETTDNTEPARYVSPKARRHGQRHGTCRTEACAVAADNVSLDTTANPCSDLYGHVCNNWIRRGAGRADALNARSYRRTVDHAHQAALSRALHKILARRTGSRSLPSALKRLYRKCLKPRPEDGAQFRSKLLDSAGVAPWPQPRRDTANAEDVSKVLGNAYYFTNEPVLLRMGVGADGLVFLAEPRLLMDGPAATPGDVAQASAAAFVSAGGQLPPPVDVNRVEKLLDSARRGDDSPPWNTTMRLAEVEPDGDRQRSAKTPPQSAWASWNLRTVIEEAFEPREAISEVVVRAPNYVEALPDLLKQVKEHELLNYLGLRTSLLASRLLPAGPEKQLLCRLTDVDDVAPARTTAEHCVRIIAKYEPALALYALATWSSLVTGLDAETMLVFLHRQLSSLLRAGALDIDDNSLSAKLADRAQTLPWVGPAPEWLNNATTRQAYIARFYDSTAPPASSSKGAAPAMFGWIQEKVVNEHLALNEPDQFVDAHWKPGLLSTRCRLVLREEEAVATGGDEKGNDEDPAKELPEATLQVPPAALDLLWATKPSTAMLQVARVGVRAYEPVLRHLLRLLQRQQRSGRNRCSKWTTASPEVLDAALESRALSLALRAFLAWPGAPELALPGLEHLSPEQLFFIFYALNQCEANGPDVEQMLATKRKRTHGTARPGLAAWINRVTSTNEDFARAFKCTPLPKQPNPFQDCSKTAA